MRLPCSARTTARLLASVCSCALFLAGQTALDQPQNPPGPRPSPAAVQTWKDRKFGMFIHFGIYSQLGGVWQGRRVRNGYSEQIMSHAPISKTDYETVARTFDPVKFDADAIVGLADAAGMKFIVITAKHHDGFNMYRTRLTGYNVYDYTPAHRDIVGELAAACRRHAMSFGVYYSSIDWHFPGATGYGLDNDRNDNAIPRAHEEFSAVQLKELTTNYGPLSEIWFDMGKPTAAQSKRFADTVHERQPDCMVSGRVFNYQGDFTVMGDNAIAPFVIDEPWQTPASIYPDTWGFRSWAERSGLAAKVDEKIRSLVAVVSRGGNYILNIGPEGDGSVVPFEADVLRGVGDWVRANAEAIYGSRPQPFRQLDFGAATGGAGRLYLFVEHWPSDGKLRLPGLENRLVSAHFLAGENTALLRVENSGTERAIVVHSAGRRPGLPVIAVTYEGALSVIPPLEHPAASGDYRLDEKTAEHFYNYNGYGYADPPTIYKLEWAAAAQPGAVRYRVQLHYTPATGAAGRIELVIGQARKLLALDSHGESEETITVTDADKTGHAKQFFTVKLTPPEPFVKGTRIAMPVQQLELTVEK